jgi:predicted Zn-dependent peptidase
MAFEGVRLKKIEEAITVTREEFAKMEAGKVTDTEVKRAKEYLAGKTALDLEDSQAMANLMVRKLLLDGKVESVDEVLKQIRAVTIEEVRAVAKEVLDDSKLNLAIVGPFKSGEKFEGLINE